MWSNVHKLHNRFYLKYPTAKAAPTRKSQTTLRAWLCSHNIVTNDLFYRICGFNFDAKTCWWSVPLSGTHSPLHYQRLMNFWRLLLVLFKFRLVQTCPKWPWKYSQACAIISALKRSASKTRVTSGSMLMTENSNYCWSTQFSGGLTVWIGISKKAFLENNDFNS